MTRPTKPSRNWCEWLKSVRVPLDPMSIDKIGDMVDNVRSCPHLGTGSCSTVDECDTDEELIADFIQWAVCSVDEADYRYHKRQMEKIRNDRANDIRNL